MGSRPILGLILVLLIAACGSTGRDAVLESGPQLISDVTIAPITVTPTRALSPTPTPILLAVSTSELVSPLEIVTLESDLQLVTPTLPPSKTPTATPTVTPPVTATRPSTMTPFFAPTVSSPLVNPVVPLPSPITGGGGQVCNVPWFFAQPQLSVCALNPPLASQGAYQPFQNGVMVWVQQQDAIYVLYNSADAPRWQVYNDAFQDGMPEQDATFNNAPFGTWQPKRGFGLVWRTRSEVRDRIGWALTEGETVYTLQVQIAADGTIFLNDSSGAVIGLAVNGANWTRY